VSAVEKILKKVDQERSKGQDDKALARLKEALAAHPDEPELVREAATLCFELGRGVEGAGILRAGLKRCPEERASLLELAREEFDSTSAFEVGELLFDAAFGEPDYVRAREAVEAMRESDRERLFTKVHAKVSALQQEDSESAGTARLVALLLAESLILSALGRYTEVAAAFSRVLDIDSEQTETVGKLCKLELTRVRDCNELRLVLARCHLNVREPGRAAEHLAAVQDDAPSRARALALLGAAPEAPELILVRVHLLLVDKQWDAAEAALAAILSAGPEANGTVRAALERVPEAARGSGALRLLYARALAGTAALDRAIHELEQNRSGGGNAESQLATVDAILEQNPRDANLLLMRARLAGDLSRHDEAAQSLRRVLEIEPGRAGELKAEIAAACESAPADAALSKLRVESLVEAGEPRDAAAALSRLHAAGSADPELLFDLAGKIAERYGFSAGLLLVFVEAAVRLAREDDARAALAHYYGSSGARIAEFGQLLEERLREHPELAAGVARACLGVAVPSALTLLLVRHRLAGQDCDEALRELGALVAAEPDLRGPALGAVEELLRARGDVPLGLELAAEFLGEDGRLAAASDYLARALRADPQACDRILRRAEPLLVQAADRDEVWRPLILGLVDIGRHRHGRDLCHRAAQTLPFDRQGFLHTALAFGSLEASQVGAAANSFEHALQCKDVPLDRVLAGLRRAVELDGEHGHTRHVLARALLQAGDHADEAVEQLEHAVRLDPLLNDLALELLAEYVVALEQHGPALVLEGTLSLRRGERERGIALLEQALGTVPELAPRILQALQVQWDAGPQDLETGLVLAHALACCKQQRRACRLIAEMSRRFPDEHARFVLELEKLVEGEPLPEAHHALWEILIARGDRAAALRHVQLAMQGDMDPDVQRELLESAHAKIPESAWIACRLAAAERGAGADARAEELLRGVLERDPTACDTVLEVLRAGAGPLSEPLAALEVDVLLAAEHWQEALSALRGIRQAYPGAGDTVLTRLRLLAARGDTGLAADLDLALVLQEKGSTDAAIEVLEAALRARPFSAAPDLAAAVDAEMGAEAGAPLGAAAGTAQGGDAAGAAGAGDPQPHTRREIRLLLASLYVDRGRAQEGRDLLAQELDGSGDKHETYAFLAQISAHGLDARRRQLQEATARAPESVAGRLELARIELLLGNFEAARAALARTGDSPATECGRRYLLARTYADDEKPQLAAPVLDSIDLDSIEDPELRQQVMHLQARCYERMGRFSEAYALYQRLLFEMPESKPLQERARAAYQRHLEASQDVPALVLEKRTNPVLTPVLIPTSPADTAPGGSVTAPLAPATAVPTNPEPRDVDRGNPAPLHPATNPTAAGLEPK
jgi:predicted Zn-dependent protease